MINMGKKMSKKLTQYGIDTAISLSYSQQSEQFEEDMI
jgi:hypothetical protein